MSPPIHLASLCTHHISDIPGWVQNRVEETWMSGSAAEAVTVHDHPLNCQNLVVWEGRWLSFPRSEASPCLRGSPLVVDKQNPNHHGKDAVSTNPVVFYFLQAPLHPNCANWSRVLVYGHYCHINGHQIQWLGYQTSGANLLRATLLYHQEAERTLKRQEHWAVPPPTHHLGLQWGSHHLVALIPSTVWEYTWH